MSKTLNDLLELNGPCLTTDLTNLVVKECKISEEAARKRVSRGSSEIRRLAHLPFPKKARFLYFQKDYGSALYWKALKSAILDHSPAYGPALSALIQRRGVMPLAHYEIASGSPRRQQKHLSAETVLNRFMQAKIIEMINVPGVGDCVALAQITNNKAFLDFSYLRARLVTEAILLKAIKMWARNLGLVSYDSVKIRGEGEENPTVGTFAWDLTGPSYLAPMVEWGKSGKTSPGFIACDVLLGSRINGIGIRPFIQKCTTLRGLKRMGRCMQMFVADSYSREALHLTKTAGIIPATPETLFGKEVAQGLLQLTNVLTRAARASINPEAFDELFQRLGRIEGAAGNLRGALFEYIVADLVRLGISPNVELNRTFQGDDGAKAEVDVVVVKPNNAVYFIECKGHQLSSTVDDKEVDRWLTKRIPTVRQYALRHPDWNKLQLHFELWTTGMLTKESAEKLDKVKTNTTKYSVKYRTAAEVKAFAIEVNNPALIKTLTQHFLMHPMSQIVALDEQ